MKIGFNMLLWTPFVTEEHFPVFEKLKETGYDGVELEVIEGMPDDYAKVGRELDRLDLERNAVSIIPDQARNPLSDDENERRAGVEHLKWAIDCAAALGAETLCGPYYQPLGEFSGQPTTEDEKQRGADAHREAAEYAQSVGVGLAVEALNRFECYFVNTMEDLAAHVRRVNHPNLGLMYDSFHANIEEKDPIGCLDGCFDLLRHVHISENDRGTPGKGHVRWDELFRKLRSGGYDAWLTIEAFGRTLPELAATICVWRDLSASIEEVYEVGFETIKNGWEEAGA